jgi:cytochrome c-type biogenesis protein CcmH
MMASSRLVAGRARLAFGAVLAALGFVFAAAHVAAQPAAPGAGAAITVAADDALTARLKHLETDLRCLVCQNQTLADSDAPLAADLRREVRELAVAGKSDDDIRAYLTARYGDFVLYNPPVKRTTWVLWFGPFVLLAGGAIAWARILRRRAAPAPDVPGDDQAAEARGRDRLS